MRRFAIGIVAAVFWLASLLAALVPWVPLLASQENTLASRGVWMLFKKRAEMTPFGSDSYLTGTQALAENRLNLHPWHGFQEVLWRNKIKVQPRRVDFRIMLGSSSHLSFVFNRTFSGFSGVRFSTRPDVAPARYIADGGGMFTLKEPLPDVALEPDVWHDCSVRFDGARVTALLDGAAYCAFEEAPVPESWFGFKGGAEFAAVDNVVIYAMDGRVFRERFDVSWRYPAVLRTIAFRAAPVEILLTLLLLAWFRSPRKSLSWLCAVHLWVAAAGVTLLWFNFSVYAKRYPHIGPEIKRNEAESMRTYIEIRRENIRDEYALEKPDGVVRVLFLGSSQTRGMGAFRSDETFANQVQRILNKDGPEGRFECIAGAIPGVTSTELLECFSGEWAGFNPDIVLVNLSCNDRDPNIFEENLRKMAAICHERGFKLLFVLEAVCVEVLPEGDPEHEVMRRVAGEEGIPLLDANLYLAERLDTGYTFWDVVHPTSYGHRLIAEFLAPAIRAELEKTAEAR